MDNLRSTSRPRRSGGGGGFAGGREDCWSEGATEALIEVWGDRYRTLNRGNLRQTDWKEVADAVNSLRDGVDPRRTDAQCKNRIDTLKKKYKLEKSKPSLSKWPFYNRLHHLIGATAAVTPSKTKSAVTVPLRVKSRPKPNPNSSGSSDGSLATGGSGDDMRKQSRMNHVDISEESACKQMARAILRFGEIYERIENSKLRQMVDLEKQRMEFTKELELQKMNIFMEAQLELAKMRRPKKHTPGAGKKL